MSKKNIVQLNNVSKSYPQGDEVVYAIKNVSLEVSKGDFVVITGRSGSGKTTMLSLIGGLTNSSAGICEVFGVNLQDVEDEKTSEIRAKKIGFVFQFSSLIPTLSALDNVKLPGVFTKQPVGEARAKELLDWVGLEKQYGRYSAQLSGGQQSRVSLARALANQAELILADEPTGNLDIETELEMMELFKEINKTKGTTVLLVTHNPELAKFGNRHLVMENGLISEKMINGSPEAVLA